MKNPRFQKKMFIYYSTVILLIIVFTVTGFSLYSYNKLTKQSHEALTNLSQQTSQTLDNLFNDMDKLALYVSSNPDVRKTFYNAYYGNYSSLDISGDIIDILTAITVPNSASKYRISLYNRKGNFVSTGLAYDSSVVCPFLSSPDYKQWYDSLPIIKSKRSFSQIYPDHLESAARPVISLYREITNPRSIQTTTGIADIQCPVEYLEDLLNQKNSSYTCCLFDSARNLLYSNTPDTLVPEDLYREFLSENKNTTAPSAKRYQNWLYASEYSSFTGFTLFLIQPASQVFSVVFTFIAMSFLLAACVAAVGLYLIFFITQKLTQPLRELSASVSQVSMNNLALSVEADKSLDEFSHLNQAFQAMFQRLQDSMDKIVTLKAHELQAHMIALQAQMDPHFLYNVLAIIKSMSRQGNTAQISKTCDCLSSMLRYNTSYKESYVPFRKELEHTENYMSLMKIRYEELFEYKIELDSQILNLNISVPKLSLQPIVENCFQHAFKDKLPPWKVHIHCWTRDNKWFFSVTDNGTGFSEEARRNAYAKIEEFLKDPSDNLASLQIGGMGLINTIARLKLKYKEQVTFTIESLPIGGTRITIGGTYYDENLIS